MIIMCAPVLELAGDGLSSVDFPAYVPGRIPFIEGCPDPGWTKCWEGGGLGNAACALGMEKRVDFSTCWLRNGLVVSGFVRAVVQPSRSTSTDPVGMDGAVESFRKRVEEEEFVEDNKELIIPVVNRRKAAWQSVSSIDIEELAPLKLV
ncbi:unnamed protein product [Lactuca virosa]|uniref:Uncharacterized protein n=1 Tax=Lactuca virosa TaxID=75947 RepID=A0AAU9M2V7_9ASTR|nr:unnamed protein product [Lactuca virosa]